MSGVIGEKDKLSLFCPILFAVLSRSGSCSGFKLADKMFCVMVSAQFRNPFHGKVIGNKQFAGKFNSALNDIIHASGIKILLVNRMEIARADSKGVGHGGDIPVPARIFEELFPQIRQGIIKFRIFFCIAGVSNFIQQRGSSVVYNQPAMRGCAVKFTEDNFDGKFHGISR